MSGLSGLSGLYAALATPFSEDEAIDFSSLRQLTEVINQQPLDGIYVGGSTGESLLQTPAEREEVLRFVAKNRSGKSKLIGHVGAISTRESRRLAQVCAEAGYDAISAIPPIYFPYQSREIIGYYKDIVAAAQGVPLIIYNIPAMSGVKFSANDLRELLGTKGIIGLKQTSFDMYQTEQLRRGFPEALILNGYDEVFLAGIGTGADGAVGSTFNIMGWRYRQLWQALQEGRLVEAQALQGQCNEVIDLLVKAGVFPALKFILKEMGVIASARCRAPFAPVETVWHDALRAVAHQLGQEAENNDVMI
ncbi:N-acetylneuraminate lyase [Sodalis sp. RH21]|uniref:N-acetylneuraminate lyase n=1 Tax=unclassified Sodalis (in: enterobacteria) TaxID=2636512 RepID=UPI0039B43D82